jgi:malate/lactate dehydrogenase
MTVPAVLGRAGVIAVPELPLEPAELDALRASAATIAEQIAALESAGD